MTNATERTITLADILDCISPGVKRATIAQYLWSIRRVLRSGYDFQKWYERGRIFGVGQALRYDYETQKQVHRIMYGQTEENRRSKP